MAGRTPWPKVRSSRRWKVRDAVRANMAAPWKLPPRIEKRFASLAGGLLGGLGGGGGKKVMHCPPPPPGKVFVNEYMLPKGGAAMKQPEKGPEMTGVGPSLATGRRKKKRRR